MDPNVLHHKDVMADKGTLSGHRYSDQRYPPEVQHPHDHTQDFHARELVQAGCRAIMEMGNTIQLLCCDDDVGLHSIGNAALTLRSWCDSMQQVRDDKTRIAKAKDGLGKSNI